MISCGRPFDWGARIIHTDCNNTIHNSFFGMENKGDNPGLLLLMNLMLTSLDDKKSITKINDLNNFVVNAIMSQYGHYYLNEYSKIRNDFKDLPFTFIQYPILTEFAKMLDSEYSINLNIEIDNRINKKVPLRKAKPNEKIFSSSIELFSKYYDKIFELCDKSLSKAIDSY